MNNYYVYVHISPNNKKYVGITKQKPERRWRKQGQGYKENRYLTKAIQKYGWDNFKHEILFYGLSQKEAEEKEIELIANAHKKQVEQVDDNNTIVNIYPSVIDASKMLSCKPNGIYIAIYRKTKSHNYYWRYREG